MPRRDKKRRLNRNANNRAAKLCKPLTGFLLSENVRQEDLSEDSDVEEDLNIVANSDLCDIDSVETVSINLEVHETLSPVDINRGVELENSSTNLEVDETLSPVDINHGVEVENSSINLKVNESVSHVDVNHGVGTENSNLSEIESSGPEEEENFDDEYWMNTEANFSSESSSSEGKLTYFLSIFSDILLHIGVRVREAGGCSPLSNKSKISKLRAK